MSNTDVKVAKELPTSYQLPYMPISVSVRKRGKSSMITRSPNKMAPELCNWSCDYSCGGPRRVARYGSCGVLATVTKGGVYPGSIDTEYESSTYHHQWRFSNSTQDAQTPVRRGAGRMHWPVTIQSSSKCTQSSRPSKRQPWGNQCEGHITVWKACRKFFKGWRAWKYFLIWRTIRLLVVAFSCWHGPGQEVCW